MPEDNKSQKTFIIIIVILIILLAGFLAWWFLFRTEGTNTNTTNGTATTNVNTSLVNVADDPVLTNVNIQDDGPLSLNRLVNLFAERLGSYTSDSEFQNLQELKVYMTDSMQTWADSYVVAGSLNTNSAYTSVISKVISTKILSQSGSSAKVELIIQKTEETVGETTKNSYNQNIVLELIKQGDDWLVDRATWENKL